MDERRSTPFHTSGRVPAPPEGRRGHGRPGQDAYYGRIDDIEQDFRGETALPSALQIRKSWYSSWNGGSRKRLWEILTWPHVALPHALVAAIALVLFVLVRLGFVPL